MLWYFSLSELGKNCTPIFSPLPMPVLSMGKTQGRPLDLSTLFYGFSV